MHVGARNVAKCRQFETVTERHKRRSAAWPIFPDTEEATGSSPVGPTIWSRQRRGLAGPMRRSLLIDPFEYGRLRVDLHSFG